MLKMLYYASLDYFATEIKSNVDNLQDAGASDA